MALFRRIFLWIITNIAVIALFSVVTSLLNIGGYLGSDGSIYMWNLLFFAAFFGFAGSLLSLLISKWMAKRTMGVQVILTPRTNAEQFLVHTVQQLASQSGIGMPEVGIYDSPEVNAFATGWNRNNALVAVSTGLLTKMDQAEIEGVLGHEMAHIVNGDMVTMTLLQGVVNTFVIFFARLIAGAISRDDDGVNSSLHYGISFVLELVFGFFAGMVVMAFSRWREYRADAGSARLVGRGKMIAALQKLGGLKRGIDPRNSKMATMNFSFTDKAFALLASHPPLEKRIHELQTATTL